MTIHLEPVFMRRIFILLSCSLLCSCFMVGPNYKEPRKRVGARWLHTNAHVTSGCVKSERWWRLFHDPTLTKLIHQGYYHNLSLYSAGVHVLQTRAQLAESVGKLYPQQQQMIGNFTYQRIGGGMLEFVLPREFETAALGFTAGWEIDFWGKYRRAVQANNATFLASTAAYDNALVTLTADIANAYISLRTDEELIRVTLQNIQVQKHSLKIAQSRFRAGQVSLIDVTQAQTELAKTQATLPSYVSDLQKQKDKISVLLATTPQAIEACIKPKSGHIPAASARIAVGIPKETLAQRPDISQARMEAVTQSTMIGAIKANLYPALSLTGTFLFAANNIGNSSLSDLFNWSNRAITAGPSIMWPLLNYGQITNAVRVQDAKFQEALLHYVDVVLKAQQEVQDNITQYIEARKALYHLKAANQSAQKTVKLALVRYLDDQNSYIFVLDAERQQLQVQISYTNARGDVSKALVALYRSLGGGWQIRRGNDIVPVHIKHEMAARTNWGNLLQKPNHQPPKTPWQRFKRLFLPNW